MDIQAQIPAALCSLHNFIHSHDPAEGRLPDADYSLGDVHATNWEQGAGEEHPAACNDLHLMRDRIAEAMWVDYQCILQERHTLGDDNDNNFSDQGILEDEEDGLEQQPQPSTPDPFLLVRSSNLNHLLLIRSSSSGAATSTIYSRSVPSHQQWQPQPSTPDPFLLVRSSNLNHLLLIHSFSSGAATSTIYS
ncbi:hypothetical protein BDR06DRAFT_1009067 [Suillus hirtellus]|nr:hypothetical protein BDR06DRAFT_1009067 [Suillus hirtellus]